MLAYRIARDLNDCREIWNQAIAPEVMTDLWDVRACFHHHFNRPLHFIVAEDRDEIRGLLPLCWIEESRCFGFFPGETWQGRTWLEQNRLCFPDLDLLQGMLSMEGFRHHLRYLSPPTAPPPVNMVEDEVGYLFQPPSYDFDITYYFKEFSGKSIKQILRDVAAVERQGVSFRYDDIRDVQVMVRMNQTRYGAGSYFHDDRFRAGFLSLAEFLHQRGWLRMTTVLIAGEPAAVDMACLYRGVLTVLAGGTDARYPGVAKLINLHHMKRACRERIAEVDFLCGDFAWKSRFHLTPRPLFLLSNVLSEKPSASPRIDARRAAYA